MPDSDSVGSTRAELQQLQLLTAIRESAASSKSGTDGVIGVVGRLADTMEKGFEALAARDTHGRSGAGFNLQTAFSFISVAFGVFMFVWTQIGSVQTSLTQRLEADSTRLTAALREVKTDAQRVDERANTNSGAIEQIREKVKEIETQLNGRDVARNILLGMEQRNTAILWKAVFKEDLPDWRYFPPEAKPGSELNGHTTK